MYVELQSWWRKDEGKGQLGSLGWTCTQVHIAVLKMDNQHGPTVQHRELCSVLCGTLDRRGVCRRMDTCICMAESLHCSLETIIILLIDYTPTQNGKFKKKLMYAFLKLPIVRHICTFPYYSVHSKAFKTCMHNLYFLQC